MSNTSEVFEQLALPCAMHEINKHITCNCFDDRKLSNISIVFGCWERTAAHWVN